MAKKNGSVNRVPAAAKKFESNLPEVAKRHHIRVSNPYGYYPEDVDKIIIGLESSVNSLEHENKELRDRVHEVSEELSKAKTELTKLKMQMTLMDPPDTSAEEDFVMLSRISTITGKNEPQVNPQVVQVDKPNIGIDTVSSPTPANANAVKSDLVKPKSDLVKPKIKL